jgi:HD-GYP domain-containing protein (c-di-GMP phosphodiesterase class II)
VTQGCEIIEGIDLPTEVSSIVAQHHERLDGSGYPNHLAGEQIPIESRIVSVADVVEAMSSDRPYRVALGIEAALKEINENKGTKYDASVVDACIKLFKQKGFKFS